MLKVLIVDDEMLVRAHIKMMINWESHGFTVIGEASNGRDALVFIEKALPDIVILDIKMPVMDGYEVSSIISRKFKSVKMIILSNYDDFQYVKGTLVNGAVDYLLKHNLNQDILLDSLNRAKSKFDDAGKKASEFYSLNNILALREKFIKQLLARFYTGNDEIKLQMQLLDISLDDNQILPIAMEIDDGYVAGTVTPETASILDYSVINIVNELLGERKNGIIAGISDHRFCILISFSDVHSEAQIQNSTNYILNTVSSCLNKFLQITVSFSIGYLCGSCQHIAASYDYAVNNLRNKFFLGKNCIIRNDYKTLHEDLSGLSIETEKQILLHVKQRDNAALEIFLNDLFIQIKDKYLTINSVKIIFHDLLNIIIKVCKTNNIELIKLFPIGRTPQEKVSAIQTIEEFKDWIIPAFQELIELAPLQNPQYASPYVNRTVSYIHKHFSRDISLSDVSEVINIGSTYLSKLFKEEVGIGFSEYLSNLRIEKAKQLLEDNKLELKDIPEKCGFNSYDYFIKAFKKNVGMTPKKFISMMQKHPY